MAGRRLNIFLPSLAGGGAERSICLIANGLAARGNSVTLVLGAAAGPFLRNVDPAVDVVDLRAGSTLAALPRLTRHLRQARPDALVSAISHANVVAAMAHALAGSQARLVLSERAHLTQVLAEYRDWRVRVNYRLMRWTYPRADRVVAVSRGVAEDLGRHIPLAPGRLQTIYNPVVDAQLQSQAAQVPNHPWLDGSGSPVVLGAGRLIAQKDFATLIDAFALLRRDRALRLLILGEGELRLPLLEQARQRGVEADVALPGFDSNPYAAMRAAAVFVLSSRFEGLPGVLIQAMACGTRVVSTNCPSGPAEVLEDGRWGALVPVGDAAAMARAIAATLDQAQAPDVRARAACFAVDAAVAAYASVLGLD